MTERTGVETITRSVHAEWRGSLRSEARVRDCPPFFTDEPEARGGLFEHPMPAEYIVSGLSGCTVAHVEMFAKEVGMPLEGCRVDGRLTMGRFEIGDDRGRNGGILGIELDVEVVSTGTEEELDRVKKPFRENCILYLFTGSATSVEDRWTLVRPG